MNSIKCFIFYLRNIFFQSIFLNQDEFSIFLLFFMIISLFNRNFSFLSLINFNIWFKRFILSKLLKEELIIMIAKYLTFIFWKNIYIICDSYHDLSNILYNFDYHIYLLTLFIYELYNALVYYIKFYIRYYKLNNKILQLFLNYQRWI